MHLQLQSINVDATFQEHQNLARWHFLSLRLKPPEIRVQATWEKSVLCSQPYWNRSQVDSALKRTKGISSLDQSIAYTTRNLQHYVGKGNMTCLHHSKFIKGLWVTSLFEFNRDSSYNTIERKRSQKILHEAFQTSSLSTSFDRKKAKARCPHAILVRRYFSTPSCQNFCTTVAMGLVGLGDAGVAA